MSIIEDELSDLYCALSSDSNLKHVVFEPIRLACNHKICRTCILEDSKKVIRCGLCGKLDKLNSLLKAPISNETEVKIKDNINSLLIRLEKQIISSLDDLKKLAVHTKEKISTIDNKIDFIKENIELRIESLKTELDILQDKLKSELDNLKNEIHESIEKDLEFKNIDEHIMRFESQLDLLQNEIKSVALNDERSLYKNQREFLVMHNFVEKLNNLDLKINFDSSEDGHITESMVGYLSISKKYKIIDCKEIENSFKDSEFKIVLANVEPIDMCQIPNGLLALCNGNTFSLYDHNFEFIKIITEINGKKVSACNITTNYVDSIYYTDSSNDQIIMCDTNFNYKKSIGSKGVEKNQFREIRGICYNKTNERLYTCDSGNNRIQVHSSKLELIKQHILEFRPCEISIIDHTACIRSFITFEKQLYFFSLPNFTLISTHAGYDHPVSVIHNAFYQFDVKNEILYCYNSNGTQIDKIASNGVRNRIQSNNDGKLLQFNNNLILSLHKYLAVI